MQASTPELAESRWCRDTGWEDVAEELQEDGGTRSVTRLAGGFPLQVQPVITIRSSGGEGTHRISDGAQPQV